MSTTSFPPDHLDPALAEAAARAELAAGRLALRVQGMHPFAFDPLLNILKSQYGIEVHQMWGCLEIPGELVAASEAFNRIMEAEISRRFGDVLPRLSGEWRALLNRKIHEGMAERAEAKYAAMRKRKVARLLGEKQGRKK